MTYGPLRRHPTKVADRLMWRRKLPIIFERRRPVVFKESPLLRTLYLASAREQSKLGRRSAAWQAQHHIEQLIDFGLELQPELCCGRRFQWTDSNRHRTRWGPRKAASSLLSSPTTKAQLNRHSSRSVRMASPLSGASSGVTLTT